MALCGYEVTIAETAMEGFEAATREQPDVVLCDIGLPDSDGYCLAEALQKNPVTSAARLIAVTAYSKDENKDRSKRAGFLLHLEAGKPRDDSQSPRGEQTSRCRVS